MAGLVESNYMRSLYQHKANRDAAFKLAGGKAAGFRKTSIRNQQIHPQYVADYAGTFETGFGNTDYQTMFGCLYSFVRVLKLDPVTGRYV